jgi:hypothetical protein
MREQYTRNRNRGDDGMMDIQHAELRRTAEIDGSRYAEVEVTEANTGHTYSVVLKPAEDGLYKVNRITEKHAEMELDWYDNDMHQAFKDVTDSLVNTEDAAIELAQRIVGYGNIREELSASLSATDQEAPRYFPTL